MVVGSRGTQVLCLQMLGSGSVSGSIKELPLKKKKEIMVVVTTLLFRLTAIQIIFWENSSTKNNHFCFIVVHCNHVDLLIILNNVGAAAIGTIWTWNDYYEILEVKRSQRLCDKHWCSVLFSISFYYRRRNVQFHLFMSLVEKDILLFMQVEKYLRIDNVHPLLVA